MAAKQLPIDLKVLGVIAYRKVWILGVLTFMSFTFSSFIVASRVNLYSASITIFVDPENVLGDIAKGVAVSSNLNDQLPTLQQLLLSDDFLQPHVIDELGLRYEDLYVPPMQMNFMPTALNVADKVKNLIKKVFQLDIYTQSDTQTRSAQQQEMIVTLKQHISLTQSRGMLLVISYAGREPRTCQKIVEILANQSKELLLRTKSQETREALRYIEQQYNDANQRLADLEKELAVKKVADFDKGPEAKVALLTQRQQTQDTLRVLAQDIQSLAAQKQDVLAKKEKRKTELQNNPQIIAELAKIAQSQATMELDALKTRLAQLKKVYTDEWPEIKDLAAEIDRKEQAVQSARKDPNAEEKIFLADPMYNEYFRQISQIETQENSLKTQEKKLNDNLAIYDQKLKNMPEVEKSFAAIQRDMALYEKLQVDLSQKRQTARATMELEKSRGENRIRVVNRSFPTKPSGIAPILLMPVLCLLGPAAGSGIIFLLYYLNNSVKSADDVQKEYNLPVIAIIPKTHFKKGSRTRRQLPRRRSKNAPPEFAETEPLSVPEIGEPEIELGEKIVKRVPLPQNSQLAAGMGAVTMLTNPDSPAAEEYRRLCFNVERCLKDDLLGSCKTVMVTSALPGEGKTLTALNLAATLAKNCKVLLVDANFRRPALHRVVGMPAEPGLSELIAQKTTPDLYVLESTPGLSMLAAGLALEHPADLLSSKPMSAFIEAVKNSSYFEYAIFDVPPVAFLPDASIIAAKLSGVVWVIWELQTSKEIVRLALTHITNPNLLGVVLNQSEQHAVPKKYAQVWKDYRGGAKQKRNH